MPRAAKSAALFAAAAMVALGAVASGQAPQAPPPAPALDLTISRSTRLLVVSPHPDDGTLGAGGLMRRVIARGGTVHVVWLTSGDGFPEGVKTSDHIARPTPDDYRSYGGLREIEARAAVASLGVDRRELSFLGFPDEGMCELASTSLSAHAAAFASPYTRRISPPITEQVIHGVTYRGTDVRRELERLLRTFRPTVVALPHPHDAHPDHCATHIFVHEALDAAAPPGGLAPRVLHYLIHYRQWPLSDDAGTGSALEPPAGFPPSDGRVVNLALRPEEAALKKNALLLFHSQLAVIGEFVLAFSRSNELFIEGEPMAMPACWCNGNNIVSTK